MTESEVQFRLSNDLESIDNPCQFIIKYLNISYYLGMFPYRAKFDTDQGKYVLVENWFQKGICLLVFVLSFLMVVLDFRSNAATLIGDKNPMTYFRLANYFSEVAIHTLAFTTQWSTSKKVLNIINFLHESPRHSCSSIRTWRVKILPPLIISTLLIYIPTNLIQQLPSWDSQEVLLAFKTIGVRLLFLGRFDLQNSDFSIIFAILSIMAIISYTLFTSIAEYLLLNFALCMNASLNDFIQVVSKGTKDSTFEVLKNFESLMKLSEMINDAVGLMTFGLVLGLLPYFVSSFVEFLSPGNPFAFLKRLIEIIDIYGFMIFAANISRKSSMVADNFLQNYDMSVVKPSDLQLLLHKISGHFVGFDGSGFFTVTCGFLGNMLGHLITYSLLLIEYRVTIPDVTRPGNSTFLDI